MTCRAPSSATTCAGASPSGQVLSYDAEGRLSQWQNQPTPTSTVSYLYDGEGTRVAQQVGNGGGTPTTTAYIGEVEEATTGAATSTTTYYYAGAERIAEAVNGVFSYLASDRLGSPVVNLSATGTVTATQLYAPYGASRYSNGVMPTDIGFTGQKVDAATGLDYYVSRYYDPSLGQFISPDSDLPESGYNPWGLSRYAYVQGNPETMTDPDGHCWPLCTMLIGAAIGAAMGAGTSIVTQAASGHGINWHDVGREAAVGAVTGAISGLAGPEAGLAAKTAISAVAGAAGQVVSNAINHKSLGDGVLMAAAVGAGSELGMAALGAVGKAALKRFAGSPKSGFFGGMKKLFSNSCNSFAADTPVATSDGDKPIAFIKVGDQVQASDPQTHAIKMEPVQQVFINHDNNLLDVTLATDTNTENYADGSNKYQDVAVLSHGVRAGPTMQKTETIHTTTEHPFLTKEQGWVNAQDLKPGEHVYKLDGTLGAVVAINVVPGIGIRYNLTVKDLHTFAVGDGQWVVHNTFCRVKAGDVGSFRSLSRRGRTIAGDGLTAHHMPQGSLSSHFGFEYGEGGAIVMSDATHRHTYNYGGLANGVKRDIISRGLTFREALTASIEDYRRIIPNNEGSIRKLVKYWYKSHPHLF